MENGTGHKLKSRPAVRKIKIETAVVDSRTVSAKKTNRIYGAKIDADMAAIVDDTATRTMHVHLSDSLQDSGYVDDRARCTPAQRADGKKPLYISTKPSAEKTVLDEGGQSGWAELSQIRRPQLASKLWSVRPPREPSDGQHDEDNEHNEHEEDDEHDDKKHGDGDADSADEDDKSDDGDDDGDDEVNDDDVRKLAESALVIR